MNPEEERPTALQWRRILAEGTAIVVSILLAFGIQAWWEGARDRAEEQKVLHSLHDELGANQIALTTNIRSVQAQTRALRALLDTDPAEVGVIPRDSVYDRLITPLRRTFTSELAVGALNSAVTSGRIGLIQDPDVRAGLAQYQARIADVSELSGALNDVSLAVMALLGRYPALAPAVGAPEEGAVDLSAPTLAAIVSDAEIRGLVSVKAYVWFAYATEQQAILEVLANVRQLIAANLGISTAEALAP